MEMSHAQWDETKIREARKGRLREIPRIKLLVKPRGVSCGGGVAIVALKMIAMQAEVEMGREPEAEMERFKAVNRREHYRG